MSEYAPQPPELVVRHHGRKVAELKPEVHPRDPYHLRLLLLEVVRQDGRDERQIGEYEMEIRYPHLDKVTIFTATGYRPEDL